jgi:hypothetical protein
MLAGVVSVPVGALVLQADPLKTVGPTVWLAVLYIIMLLVGAETEVSAGCDALENSFTQVICQNSCHVLRFFVCRTVSAWNPSVSYSN